LAKPGGHAHAVTPDWVLNLDVKDVPLLYSGGRIQRG